MEPVTIAIMKLSVGMALVGVVAVAGLAGCKKGVEAQLEGKWTMSKAPNVDPKNPAAAMIQGMMKSVTIEFKKDHKFSMTMMIPIEGTYSVSGNSVSLSPTSIMGMSMDQIKSQSKNNPAMAKSGDMDKPMNATLSEDGKTLTVDDKSGKGAMEFTKDASSS